MIDAAFARDADALVLGMMSGTSLDGLDLAAVRLRSGGDQPWRYELLASETVAYDEAWRGRLDAAFALDGAPADQPERELRDLDLAYGRWLGRQVGDFCDRHGLRPALVASHGHTVHHRPADGVTRQIGDPATLAAASGLPVVADFRSLDVSLGGQGAPLVPVADRLLFGRYGQCLNLGGFANVSFEYDGERRAYDVTAVNILLNRLAAATGRDYDADGALARSGQADEALLERLDGLPYYGRAAPKSLGREWLEREVWPLFVAADLAPRNALATATEHIAGQLSAALAHGPAGSVLVTGGGAYNGFLIECTRQRLPATHELVLPEGALIDYKEAIAFALLGALRVRGEVTALASVTGASRDSCGGVVVGLRTSG